jgi:hypothetical protein
VFHESETRFWFSKHSAYTLCDSPTSISPCSH